MKMKISNTKTTRNTKLYVVHGVYDNSGQYHEAYYKKFALKQFPEDIYNEMAENLNHGCDMTALVFPSLKTIFVFLPKNRKNKFLRYRGENTVRKFLDSELEKDFTMTQHSWVGYNFAEE